MPLPFQVAEEPSVSEMLDDLAKSQLVVVFRGPVVDSTFPDQARLFANGIL